MDTQGNGITSGGAKVRGGKFHVTVPAEKKQLSFGRLACLMAFEKLWLVSPKVGALEK